MGHAGEQPGFWPATACRPSQEENVVSLRPGGLAGPPHLIGRRSRPALTCLGAGPAGGAPPPRSCAPHPPPSLLAATWRCAPEASHKAGWSALQGFAQAQLQRPARNRAWTSSASTWSTRSWNSQEEIPASSLAWCQRHASSGRRSRACMIVGQRAAVRGRRWREQLRPRRPVHHDIG